MKNQYGLSSNHRSVSAQSCLSCQYSSKESCYWRNVGEGNYITRISATAEKQRGSCACL